MENGRTRKNSGQRLIERHSKSDSARGNKQKRTGYSRRWTRTREWTALQRETRRGWKLARIFIANLWASARTCRLCYCTYDWRATNGNSVSADASRIRREIEAGTRLLLLLAPTFADRATRLHDKPKLALLEPNRDLASDPAESNFNEFHFFAGDSIGLCSLMATVFGCR